MSKVSQDYLKKLPVLVVLAMTLLFTQAAVAQIVPVGPFTGDALEDFEGFSNGNPGTSFGVFGSTATHNQLSGSTPRIWGSGGWGLGSNGLAQAFDGSQGFGMNGFSTGEFIFTAPITSFGAYFGTAFPGDTMFLEFYDSSNILIGTQQSWAYTRPGDGVLEWHGYSIGQQAVRVVWGSLSASGAAPAIDSIRVASTTLPPAIPVPTLSTWAIILTALVLLLVASGRLRASARRSH